MSHSSADKERFVVPFATRLRTDHGIDVWVDQWEIVPGDSIVDRIYQHGIGQAAAFIAIISRSSIDSPWVNDELDAGTVRRIEQGTRLIPIILDGIAKQEIPVSLHHIRWVRIEDPNNFEEQLEQVARAIHGHDPSKPPLGRPPSYTTLDIQVPGLGKGDVTVLLAIGDDVRDTTTGFVRDPGVVRSRCRDQGMSDEEFVSSVRFLDESGLLQDDPIGLSGNLHVLWLSPEGIGAYLRARSLDLEDLARRLAAHVVNQPTIMHGYRDLTAELEADPLAVAHVANLLDARGLLRVRRAMGDTLLVGYPTESLKRSVQ